MDYKRYRMTYYLEDGNIIQDVKEFYYRDKMKMLKRVLQYIMFAKEITVIDSSGNLISIPCNNIIKVQLNHLS
ncbi:DUF3929 family protein [Microbacteriaceae bacterium 4G12]